MIYNSNYGDIYYEVSGPQDGPAIVLCHGVGMDHKTFADQVAVLKARYRVIVWDMPGHGRSTLTDHRTRFSLMATDCLIGILDQENIDKAVLAGLSLGSFVIQRTYAYHPSRVIATIHIGGMSLTPRYPRALKPLFSLVALSCRLIPPKAFYRTFAKHRANKDHTREYMEQTIAKAGVRLVIRVTRDMGADLTEDLPKMPQKPILITAGEDDFYVHRFSHRWRKQAPDSEPVLISDAHHVANQDNPNEFNQVMLSFVESVLD